MIQPKLQKGKSSKKEEPQLIIAEQPEPEPQIPQEQAEEEKKQPVKKRQRKAAAKKVQKAARKKPEPPKPREDVIIPDSIENKDSKSEEPIINCCQTCSNRNCLRAVNIDSVDLFIKCVKSRAYITSLIEHMAPELRYSALEKAISMNRVEILEVLLS